MKKHYIIFLVWVGLLVLFSPFLFLKHGDMVLSVYERRTMGGNMFFKWFTHLGSSYIYIPFAVYYLKINKKKAYGLFLSWILHVIVVLSMKRTIFEWTPRPVEFFKSIYQFDLIEGLSYPVYDSFPSGHTATIFTIIIYLLLLQRKLFLVPIGFLVAILVGFSRIYLLQHFFVDVYTGAFIGGISAFIAYAISRKYHWLE